MIRRLTSLTVVVVLSFLLLAGLGFHALSKWQAGLAGERLGQYAEVADAVARDVGQQLDRFLEREERRPYTDYLYYHVADPAHGLNVRSSLGGRLDHGLAYGHFQIEPDGTILTPNDNIMQQEGFSESNGFVERANQRVRRVVQQYILPSIQGNAALSLEEEVAVSRREPAPVPPAGKQQRKGAPTLKINNLSKNRAQASQVVQQSRSIYNANFSNNSLQMEQQQVQGLYDRQQQAIAPGDGDVPVFALPGDSDYQGWANEPVAPDEVQEALSAVQQEEPTIQIRIEPFVPLRVPEAVAPESLFGTAVYLVRHVQFEGRHLLQGFRLQEGILLDWVRSAAQRHMREGMAFTLTPVGQENGRFRRRLDFGFGEVVFSLMDINPQRLNRRVQGLRFWYLGVLGLVAFAVGLGLLGLWRGAGEQLALSRKKDDFISAVSHELRTPLTSIRMYAEMLEQNWVASPEKRQSYYSQIRQESERLSRLIENVLDFSRMQRGRKKFTLVAGDLNTCLQQIVDTLAPYVRQQGFTIHTEFAADLPSVCFDRDAVSQIVVNLVDNAVKYAARADDKTIWIRTLGDARHVYIEVEDRGPGIPSAQRQRIFEQFYRLESEATRETQGTGLGLALVKRFAEAHRGFVRLRAARPGGAVFQVALARSC